METSEELRQVAIRFFETLRDGDEEAVRNRVSRQPGFERFGTDPDEVWHDGEVVSRLWVQQMRELGGGYPWRLIDEVYALSEGTVGWAGGRTEIEAPVDGSVEYRFTCVLHLEHSEWKIVQWHSSVPTSNEEHGFFLTKSVDEIAEAVSEARPDLSPPRRRTGRSRSRSPISRTRMRLNAFLGDRRWLEVLRAHNDVVNERHHR